MSPFKRMLGNINIHQAYANLQETCSAWSNKIKAGMQKRRLKYRFKKIQHLGREGEMGRAGSRKRLFANVTLAPLEAGKVTEFPFEDPGDKWPWPWCCAPVDFLLWFFIILLFRLCDFLLCYHLILLIMSCVFLLRSCGLTIKTIGVTLKFINTWMFWIS